MSNTSLPPSGQGQYSRRPGPRRRFQPVLITFPPEWISELDEAATRLGHDNRSQFVRWACAPHLKSTSDKQEGTDHV
jgi:metal-responsive CopG/Arc/MetJ family transcriptional regulator